MCVVSMVYDHWNKQFPWSETYPGPQPWEFVPDPIPVDPIPFDLGKAIKDFQKAKDAAQVVDELTGQSDCVDPEKQKLEERVKELEAMLANPPEIVILKGGTITPGRYRVIDGLLYRLVDE